MPLTRAVCEGIFIDSMLLHFEHLFNVHLSYNLTNQPFHPSTLFHLLKEGVHPVMSLNFNDRCPPRRRRQAQPASSVASLQVSFAGHPLVEGPREGVVGCLSVECTPPLA
jgi:hypothetical protein